jgi:hypothetical protein
MKSPLSRWRERAGVRVDTEQRFPLTFILSPGGERKLYEVIAYIFRETKPQKILKCR